MAHDRAEFSVYQFFPSGMAEKVLAFVPIEEAMEMAIGLANSVGGRVGTTRRIIITDGGDFTVFEWMHGVGITHPNRKQEQQA